MILKKYQISAETKKKLEGELKNLETQGRQNIADKLDQLRQIATNEKDEPFSELLEDKAYLEMRILEVKEILKNSKVLAKNAKHKVAEVGSTVKVGFEGFEEIYKIVSSIEADPINKKISDESPVGKALLGHKLGDNAEVKIGNVVKKFRILKIS